MASHQPSPGQNIVFDPEHAQKHVLHDELKATEIDSVERDVHEVLRSLQHDPALARFRDEYEKLYHVLCKSHDNEKHLLAKCRELNADIVSNVAKVQTALQLSEEDQATIVALKGQLEKSWKALDASIEKEVHLKEQIAQLKHEITTLNDLVDGTTPPPEVTESLHALTQQRDALVAERDAHTHALVVLREESDALQEQLRVAQAARVAAEGEVVGLREEMGVRKAEGEREARKRDRLEREVKDLKVVIEARQAELRDKQTAIQQGLEYTAKLEGMVRDAQAVNSKMNKEVNVMQDKVHKFHRELEEQLQINAQLLAASSQRQLDIQAKETELTNAKLEMSRVAKARDAIQTKLLLTETQKAELEQQHDALKAEVYGLQREAEAAAKQLQLEQMKQDQLARERDALVKQKTQSDNGRAFAGEAARAARAQITALEQELAAFKIEQRAHELAMRKLQNEKQQYGQQVAALKAQYTAAQEALAARDREIEELQEQVTHAQQHLTQQQHVYETLRTERNATAKQLLDLRDDISSMRRKFKAMHHQMEQLKEECKAKDLGLAQQHYIAQRGERERTQLTVATTRLQQEVSELEGRRLAQRLENDKLENAAVAATQEATTLKRERDAATVERDKLQALLLKRNKEAALLYEKIRVLNDALYQGRVAHKQRLDEIRMLKIKVLELRREQHRLQTGLANVDVLKREVHHLGCELLAERSRVRAMADELETPLNVHRWRTLEASDPPLFEMIVKVQILQRRLIAKTEQVAEKDLMLAEKERLYTDLKAVLARHPGPEVAEQLSEYRAALRDKSKQMKALGAEVSMHAAQCDALRTEIASMGREMDALKKRYFALKKQQRQGSEE